MQTNVLPRFDDSVNTTGCCAKFNPEGWDGQSLHFEGKPFVRATTISAAHVPLNMGKVFGRVLGHLDKAGAVDLGQQIVMSHDISPWQAEHLFAVTMPVEGEEMVSLSGDFLTQVFEGPFSKAGAWAQAMQEAAVAQGKVAKKVWFYYTTCPKCAKAYGQNYVVGLAEI